LGAGMHSQLQPIVIYFIEDEESGKTTNEDLDFTKSIHLATGWDSWFFFTKCWGRFWFP